MTDSASPNYPSERVFRFISDPEHKENLSGRVQAACLTCRRKKIKCSGEFNCTTCVEKGLVCEGLPERKRPRRESMMSFAFEHSTSSGGERKRKLSSTKEASPLQRPISRLREQGSSGSDWGYGGSRRASTGALLHPGTAALFEEWPSLDHTTSSKSAARTPMTPFRVDIWEVGSSHDSSAETGVYLRGKQRSQSVQPAGDDNSSSAQLAFHDVETAAADWTNMQDDLSWWQPDLPTAEPDQEPHKPRLQERRRGQSRDPSIHLQQSPVPHPHLPRITQTAASPQLQLSGTLPRPQIEPQPTQSRRQTVQFPLPHDTTTTNTTDSNALYDLLTNKPGVFDEMARLLASRPPREDLIPSAPDLTPWWDVNDEISAMLSQAGDVLTQPHPETFEITAIAPTVEGDHLPAHNVPPLHSRATNPPVVSATPPPMIISIPRPIITLTRITTPTGMSIAASAAAAAAAASAVPLHHHAPTIHTPTSIMSPDDTAHDSPGPVAASIGNPEAVAEESADPTARKNLVDNFYW